MIGSSLALAGGPAPTEEVDPAQHDACMLGVLMDWEQDQALVFRVVNGQVDQESGVPLIWEYDNGGEVNIQFAAVPFEDVSIELLVPSHEFQFVFGVIAEPYTDMPLLLVPYTMGTEEITVQGLTGHMQTIYDPFGCEAKG